MTTLIEPRPDPNSMGWRAYFLQPPARHCRIAVILVLLLGVEYRLSQYLANRSFWLDEGSLLSNILSKDIWSLMGELDHDQTAPPLFLWAERGLALALGPSEWVMRLVPLMAGVIAMFLLAILAWRLLAPAVSFWVVAWFALCTDLVWHAVCMKQYSSDAMVSAAMLLSVAGWRGQITALWRWGLLVTIALPAVWFSQPAILMFAGISVALLPELRRRGRVGIGAWLAGNVLVAVVFAIMFWSMRNQRVPGLIAFWHEDLADWTRPWTIPWWLLRETYRLCELPYKAFGPLMTALCLLGGMALWKRDRALLPLYVLPIAAAAGAGLLRLSPYHGGRVTIFLVPGLLLLAGAGLDWLRQNLKPAHRPWWWAAALPMVLYGVGEAAVIHVHPMGRSHIRPVVQYLRQHRTPGEAIYFVSEGRTRQTPKLSGGIEFLCYWPNPDPPVYLSMAAPQLIPEQRFWVVFAFLPKHGIRQLETLLDDIRLTADEMDHLIVKEGGAAYLFQRR